MTDIIRKSIRTIPNFPIEGVMFRDITSLMQDPQAFRLSCDKFYQRYKDQKIDAVLGIDARGLIFGAVLAYQLGVSFVPIRKKGKLPADTISAAYNLEYGTAEVEIHKDALKKSDRVLIVDDLIATGGTVGAAVKLVKQLGGEVLECAFVIELPDLKGRENLGKIPVFSLVSFEGE